MDSREPVTTTRATNGSLAAPSRFRRACAAILLACAVAFSCGDDEPLEGPAPAAETVDPTPYLGRYQLMPSARGESIVLFRDGAVTYRDEFSERTGRFHIDRQMLRIYLGSPTEPTGVFLLKAFHRRDWRGYWEGGVRSLKK